MSVCNVLSTGFYDPEACLRVIKILRDIKRFTHIEKCDILMSVVAYWSARKHPSIADSDRKQVVDQLNLNCVSEWDRSFNLIFMPQQVTDMEVVMWVFTRQASGLWVSSVRGDRDLPLSVVTRP